MDGLFRVSVQGPLGFRARHSASVVPHSKHPANRALA